MGAAPSNGPMSAGLIRRFFDPADTFKVGRSSLKKPDGETPGCDALAAYCILGELQSSRIASAAAAFRQLRIIASKDSTDAGFQAKDRSLGCFLGNVVGDALGAPLEFSSVRYGSNELKGLDHENMWRKNEYNSFNLNPGQWTDDGSMALCIMDSLLCCNGFNAFDLRQRFHAWNRHGYNNAFGRSESSRGSVGLGGNISASMGEWEESGTAETTAGDQYTSGNGSLMRNGAVPVWYRGDLQAGMDAAAAQSRTTHAGFEAAELCRLLTFICIKFINGADRDLLEDLTSFKSPSYAVTCLANARCEEHHEQNADPIFGELERRKWDWKSLEHRYCQYRAEQQPGYVGSYAMDAMSMALHCVYTTSSFTEATLKAANLRGDADTVCAVTGQIAGALYGATAIPDTWLARVQRWDGGTILARAVMLHQQEAVDSETALGDAACASAGLLGTVWPPTMHQET